MPPLLPRIEQDMYKLWTSKTTIHESFNVNAPHAICFPDAHLIELEKSDFMWQAKHNINQLSKTVQDTDCVSLCLFMNRSSRRRTYCS